MFFPVLELKGHIVCRYKSNVPMKFGPLSITKEHGGSIFPVIDMEIT